MNNLSSGNSSSVLCSQSALLEEKATPSLDGSRRRGESSEQDDKSKVNPQVEHDDQPSSPQTETQTEENDNDGLDCSAGGGSSSSSRGGSSFSRSGSGIFFSGRSRRGSTLRMHLTHVLLITTLWIVAVGMSVGVYIYLSNDQKLEFKRVFASYSYDILSGFQDAVEKKLNAIDTLATAVTETSKLTNQTFPFVSIPDFETRGSTVRVLSDALLIFWLPLVTDETRQEWEEYAMANRKEVIEGSFLVDEQQRQKQDQEFGFFNNEAPENQGGRDGQRLRRRMEESSSPPPPIDLRRRTQLFNVLDESVFLNGTGSFRIEDSHQDQDEEGALPPTDDPNVVPDGTNYHKQIFNVLDGSVLPTGTGPFLPVWQQTPAHARTQAILNLDFNRAPALGGVLPMLLEDPSKAILHRVFFPTPTGKKQMVASLATGQYRHDGHAEDFLNDPVSFMAYPVFDSLDVDNRQFVGVLAVNLYWSLYFTGILPSSAEPIVCVLSNSYNQTFAYHIDGASTIYLGEGDPHDSKYDNDPDFEVKVRVNQYIASRASPDKRGYTTASLHQTYGATDISIYPSIEMEHKYVTAQPITYAISIGVGFLVLSLTIVYMFSRALAQHSNAKTEKDLTAYVAHELRNPLGAMDSALYSMPDDSPPGVLELVSSMRVCSAFMIRLMNNLLDARQLEEGKMELHPHPTSLPEVLDQVSQMLRPSVREGVVLVHRCNTKAPTRSSAIPNVSSITEASESPPPAQGDWVECDKDRFQQVIINVVSNAIKYTTNGSITMSFHWEDSAALPTRNIKMNQRILIFVCKDTGPGIPKDLQSKMFHRFVGRGGAPGSGLGLAISKLIVERMGGTIRFHSDPSVKPGTTCVVRVPMQLYEGPELFMLSNNSDEDNAPCEVPREIEAKMEKGGTTTSIPKPSAPLIMEEISILVVDDIKMNRAMLKRRFRKCVAPNCVVSEASTGEEAMEILLGRPHNSSRGDDVETGGKNKTALKKFDVIIVDQYMEEAGGVLLGTDTVYAMRRSGIKSLIIGCSGNAMSTEFLKAGANFFWDKPLPTNPRIIKQLREGLKLKKPDNENQKT